MNSSIFSTILWKEYRSLRAFWIGNLGLGALLLWIGTFTGSKGEVVVLLPCLYVLGCAAMMFAGEREEGTDQLLANWAIAPAPLAWAKITYLVFTSIALLALLLSMAVLMPSSTHLRPFRPIAFGYFGMSPMSVIAWSLFWSLLLRRPLLVVTMTLASTVGATFVIALCLQLARIILRSASVSAAPTVEEVSGGWAMFSLLILIADAWLLSRWVQHRPVALQWNWSTAEIEATPTLAWREVGKRKPPTLLGSLFWQEIRQSWFPIGILSGALILMLMICSSSANLSRGLPMFLLMVFVCTVPALFGIFTFRAEQDGEKFRFLAERGVSPIVVWCTKQVIWSSAFVIACMLTILLMLLSTLVVGVSSGRGLDFWEIANLPTLLMRTSPNQKGAGSEMAFGMTVLFLSYASGQLASMFLSRSVSAAFIGIVVAGSVACWTSFMYLLDTSLLITAVPIGVVFLLITLIRSRDWMLQRTGLWRWRSSLVLCFLALVAIISNIAFTRINEIAPVPLGLSSPTFPVADSPEDEKTGEMLTEARDMINNMYQKSEESRVYPRQSAAMGWQFAQEFERELLEKGGAAIDLAIAASKRDGCKLASASGQNPADLYRFNRLAELLVLSARKLEYEGKLEKAWDRYKAGLTICRMIASQNRFIYWQVGQRMETDILLGLPNWAAHPKQSQERIIAAIRELETHNAAFPFLTQVILEERRLREQRVEEDWSKLLDQQNLPRFAKAGYALAQILPWERVRARRLADRISYEEQATANTMEVMILRSDFGHVRTRRSDDEFQVNKRMELWKVLSNTPVGMALQTFSYEFIDQTAAMSAMRRRAVRIHLALYAYRMKNGRLPEKLDDLVGDYFTKLPLDPFTGSSFEYLQKGFPHPVEFFGLPFIAQVGMPLFWSSGLNGERIVAIADSVGQPKRYVRLTANGITIPALGGISSSMHAFPIIPAESGAQSMKQFVPKN